MNSVNTETKFSHPSDREVANVVSRSPHSAPVIVRVLPVVLTASLFLSCLNPFAPRRQLSTGHSDLIITEQKTPEEVLQNFRYAYVFKDSLLYSQLLDSSFIFVYFDPNLGTSGQFVSWGRDIDLRTTARLFRNFDVIDLIWNSTIYESVQENTGEITKSFDLTMLTKDEDIRISGLAVFSFRRSPVTGKWLIVRWKDESNL